MPVKRTISGRLSVIFEKKKIRGCKFGKSGSKIVAKGFPFTEITEEKVSDKVTNEKRRAADCKNLTAGIDIGSTTTKVTVVDPCDGRILYFDYRRHQAESGTKCDLRAGAVKKSIPPHSVSSGHDRFRSKAHSRAAGVPFIQEVAANAEALKSQYENIGTSH